MELFWTSKLQLLRVCHATKVLSCCKDQQGSCTHLVILWHEDQSLRQLCLFVALAIKPSVDIVMLADNTSDNQLVWGLNCRM